MYGAKPVEISYLIDVYNCFISLKVKMPLSKSSSRLEDRRYRIRNEELCQITDRITGEVSTEARTKIDMTCNLKRK